MDTSKFRTRLILARYLLSLASATGFIFSFGWGGRGEEQLQRIDGRAGRSKRTIRAYALAHYVYLWPHKIILVFRRAETDVARLVVATGLSVRLWRERARPWPKNG